MQVAKNLMQPDNDEEDKNNDKSNDKNKKDKRKSGHKEKKAKYAEKTHKARKSKKKESTSSSSSSSTDSDEDSNDGSETKDPETICNNLALQLGLNAQALKLKASKIVQVADLSGEKLSFLLAASHRKLPDLNQMSLYELGGELLSLRKQINSRVQAEQKKGQSSKKRSRDEAKADVSGEAIIAKRWVSRLCEIYELLGVCVH